MKKILAVAMILAVAPAAVYGWTKTIDFEQGTEGSPATGASANSSRTTGTSTTAGAGKPGSKPPGRPTPPNAARAKSRLEVTRLQASTQPN